MKNAKFKPSTKIVINYYLFIGLAIIAQAFFIVLSGNQKIEKNQQLALFEKQKLTLEKEITVLQNDIAQNQSMMKQKQDLSIQTEYVEIKGRESIQLAMARE